VQFLARKLLEVSHALVRIIGRLRQRKVRGRHRCRLLAQQAPRVIVRDDDRTATVATHLDRRLTRDGKVGKLGCSLHASAHRGVSISRNLGQRLHSDRRNTDHGSAQSILRGTL